MNNNPMTQQKRNPALNARLLVLPLLLADLSAFAAPPDAGQVLKEIRPAPARPASEVLPTHIEERAASSPSDGARIMVKGVRISGQSVFPEAELLALVSDAAGKELSLADLNQLAARITAYYRKHGYSVARAYLPAQDIRGGQVKIAVLEGRLGKVKIDNSAGLGDSALAPVASLAAGTILRKNELEASLLALADLPGVKVKSVLRPGESIGTSDLLVDVAPGRAITGSVDLDNYGNRYTGDMQAGGSVYFNNPLKRGDQLSLRVQSSGSGLGYGLIGYQLPLGSRGTRVGAAWSQMHYKLGKDFAGLNADGDAGVSSIHVLHPFVRGRLVNLYGQARYETKRLTDRVGVTAVQTDKTLDNWTVGFNGDRTDALGGGGTTSFALSYTAGKLGLDAVSQTIDAGSAQSSGRFGKTSLTAQRLQSLTDKATFYFSYAGQWAGKNLDSAEKFALGGATGVRAYPVGEASGDEGQLLTAEVRWRVREHWQLKGFYDDGYITVNRSPWPKFAGTNTRHLAGAGVGASFNSGEVSVDVLAAWKTGTGSPTSDTDRTPRIWLQAVRYF